MKKLLFLLPLLTACSSVQFKQEREHAPTMIHIQPPAESASRIPVFLFYGPNAVGYETVIETTLGDGNALKTGMKLACNLIVTPEYHRLIEGTLKNVSVLDVDLPFLIFDTPEFKDATIPLIDADVEFCLAYYVPKEIK